MKSFKTFSIVILLFISLGVMSSAYAAPKTAKSSSSSNPYIKFPGCPSPGGSQVASYPEGWHWIVGESTLRWGSDFVYRVSDARYVQCYCSLEKKPSGIQTNWLPAALVTEVMKQNLLAKGWLYVANGADFGLENIPFLAQNITSKCTPPKPSPTPRPSPTPKPTPSPICETIVDQSNKTNAQFQIGAGSNTGKNTAGANTGGTIDTKTGNATNNIDLKTTGGDNVVQKSPESSSSSNLHIVISGNGDGSTTTVGVN